jgi:hypothetical protein
LSVTLTPDQLEAKVTESQLGAVTFDGNVTVDKPQGVERVTVSLSGDTDKGWPISVSPQTIVFINLGTQRFSFTVIVAPATPVSKAIGTVLAHGHSPIWDAEVSVSVHVNVRQYFKMLFSTSSESFDSEPGGTVAGILYVNNSGNGEDTFTLSIEDPPKELSRWSFEPETVTVPSGRFAEVKFSLRIKEDMDVGMDGKEITVNLKVQSMEANEKGLLYAKTLPVEIFIPGFEDHLIEEWPTYVGLGVVATIIIVPLVFVIRKRKRQGEPSTKTITEGQ